MSKREADKAPVIQLIRGAEPSAGERFLHRILPAGVASAGLHLLLAGGVGLYAWLNPTPEAKASGIQEVAVAVEQRPDAPEPEDLTTLNDKLDDTAPPTSIDDAPLDTKTIQAKLNEPDAVGNPDGKLDTKVDSLLNAGADNPNALMQGAITDGAGIGAIGTGQNGLAIANDSFRGRGSQVSRDNLAVATGGSTASQQAVARGLTWLAKQQKPDGGWTFDGSNKESRVAATGLALLPFLAAGQTHKPFKGNDYQKTVAAGLAWLIKQQKTNGSFANNAYQHGIATVAICEAFGMTSDKALLLRPAQAAVDYIQRAQGPGGSWGYNLDNPGDWCISIAGWQIQALHSAKMCKDLKVNPAVITKAMKFLDTIASGSSKSKYGYDNAKSPTPGRTAIGLLCRYYLNGWGSNNPGMKDGVAYLLKDHPAGESAKFDMYYYYYATQVMHFYEGEVWKVEWNPKMRDLLTGKQRKEAARPEVDGSWDAERDGHFGPQAGRLGTTCLALLTLEVYYRHLPLYNRGTGGKTDLEGK